MCLRFCSLAHPDRQQSIDDQVIDLGDAPIDLEAQIVDGRALRELAVVELVATLR